MGKSGAERQRAYRERQRKDVLTRREVVLSANADMALRRLMRHYASPVTVVMERAIMLAEHAVTGDMSRAQLEAYNADLMGELLADAERRSRRVPSRAGTRQRNRGPGPRM